MFEINLKGHFFSTDNGNNRCTPETMGLNTSVGGRIALPLDVSICIVWYYHFRNQRSREKRQNNEDILG